MISSADVIEQLTDANTKGWPMRDQHVFREALNALVRLAKAEKLLEMRRDTARAVGISNT